MELQDIADAVEGHHQTTKSRIDELETKLTDQSHRSNDQLLAIEQKLGGIETQTRTLGRIRPTKPEFDIKTALLGLIDPGAVDTKDNREFTAEAVEKSGRELPLSRTVAVPLTKTVTVGAGTGNNLVGEQYHANRLIDLLRQRSTVIDRSTVLPNLVGDQRIPRKTSGSSAAWFNLDDVDAIVESDVTFDPVQLSPKSCAGLVRYSHRMLVQSDPEISAIIADDLADTIAIAIDQKFFDGAGGLEPLGLFQTPGISKSTYTPTAQGGPSHADLVSMEQRVSTSNALTPDSEYFYSSDLITSLKTTDKLVDTGNFLLSNNQINGYGAVGTNHVPNAKVLFGDMSDCVVGFWGNLFLLINPFGNNDYVRGNVAVRAILDVDFAVRRPSAFDIIEI